jgi:hypothetical protein
MLTEHRMIPDSAVEIETGRADTQVGPYDTSVQRIDERY